MLDLGPIKERCGKATPGPWLGDRFDGTVKYAIFGHGGPDACEGGCTEHDHGTCSHAVLRVDHKNGDYGFVAMNGDADEDFVLRARTDVPALVAEVERLRAEAAEVRAKAFEEAAAKFMAVEECEDKLCHHPRICVVTVAESLLRMAADIRAKVKE